VDQLGHDWTSPTLLDSPTCLLLLGQKYFGYVLHILLGKADLPPITDLAPICPVLCLGLFPLFPTDLGVIS